jgi:hypothetical protein
MKKTIIRAFHPEVRKKERCSVRKKELFSVLFRDQDEKLGESLL